MAPKIPETFDWVSARRMCSIEDKFADLRMDVQSALRTRNRMSGSEVFSFSENGAAFSVMRKADSACVDFRLEGRHVHISGHQIDPAHETLETGLDDDGRCILLMGGVPVRRWRVVCNTLDALFFDEGLDRPR